LKLALDEPKATDEVYIIKELKYVVDRELMKEAEDVYIEFLDMGWQRGICVVSENPVGRNTSCAGS
jgi:hypothetical protein